MEKSEPSFEYARGGEPVARDDGQRVALRRGSAALRRFHEYAFVPAGTDR